MTETADGSGTKTTKIKKITKKINVVLLVFSVILVIFVSAAVARLSGTCGSVWVRLSVTLAGTVDQSAAIEAAPPA